MKKLALSILALLALSLGTYAQCFTPAWSSSSQDTMNFHVTLASLNGNDLQVGDEIGIFDGPVCVGVGVLSQVLTGGNTLVIMTLVNNSGTGSIDGYTPGNAISYQFCIGGELSNPAVVPTYISGSTIFAATMGRDSAVVELRAVNTAPTFDSTPITDTPEDALYSYTATASDLDGDDLTFSASVLPSWLLFDEDTQELSGTPGNDEVGDHDVTLSVSDGTDVVDQIFTISVSNENDAPVFTSTPIITASEDVLYSYTATASDDDVTDILTFSAPTLPPWLDFNETTQELSGTPLNENVGIHPVVIRVNDGTVDVDQSFSITVGNENDAPVFTSIPITTAEQGTEYSYTATAEDVDLLDILSFSALELPGWLLFDVDTQILNGTPGNDDVGDNNVSLMVSDGITSDTQTFVITVGDINDAPVFTSIPITTAEQGAEYSYTATAEDVDLLDILSFSALELPAWLLFNVDTQVLNGTPGNDDVGDHNVSLMVSDGITSDTQTFILVVANVNDEPVFTSTPVITASQGSAYTYTATAEDIDADDTLTFSAPVLPAWLSFDADLQVLSGTPGNEHVGDNSVSLVVNDGTVDVVQSFIINVGNINDPPVFTSTPVTEARPGVAYQYTVTAEDIDGDALTFTAQVLPGWLTFNPSNQLLSATPSDSDVGDQLVIVRVSDGSLYAEQTFVVTVDYGNHAPNFISDPATVITVGDSYVYTISAYDIDGDELIYSAPVLPDWLTFYEETNVVSGIPRIEDVGIHNVTVRVSDGTVSADQSFPITVQEENIEPVFTSTPGTSVTEGSLYVYYVTAEDGNGDDLSFSATLLPDWLNFDPLTGILHGTPASEDIGDHNVTISVSDGDATIDQNFTITVEVRSGVGIFDLHSPEFLVVYPNPSTGRFILAFAGEFEKELQLEIIDPLGKVLIKEVFPAYQLIREEYNLADRPDGMYFIRVFYESDQIIRKLILQ